MTVERDERLRELLLKISRVLWGRATENDRIDALNALSELESLVLK